MATGSQAAAVQLKAQLDEHERALAGRKEAVAASSLENDQSSGLC